MSTTPFADRRFDALLFDMDGTLLTSIRAAERVWAAWGRCHGLDVDTFLPTIHGVRTQDTVRRQNLPGIDVDAEVAAITAAEIADTEGVETIAGAVAFLATLPPERWAIVTSASLPLATSRLAAAGLPRPAVLVTAEDVERGKPAPDGYRLAAERLGVDVRRCLVLEDAPAGIAAGEAAGAAVLVIGATHTHPVATPHPVVQDYRGLVLQVG